MTKKEKYLWQYLYTPGKKMYFFSKCHFSSFKNMLPILTQYFLEHEYFDLTYWSIVSTACCFCYCRGFCANGFAFDFNIVLWAMWSWPALSQRIHPDLMAETQNPIPKTQPVQSHRRTCFIDDCSRCWQHKGSSKLTLILKHSSIQSPVPSIQYPVPSIKFPLLRGRCDLTYCSSWVAVGPTNKKRICIQSRLGSWLWALGWPKMAEAAMQMRDLLQWPDPHPSPVIKWYACPETMGYKISIIKAKGQRSKKVQLSAEHSISGPGHLELNVSLANWQGGISRNQKE